MKMEADLKLIKEKLSILYLDAGVNNIQINRLDRKINGLYILFVTYIVAWIIYISTK